MALILDHVPQTPLLEGIQDWPRSCSREEWCRTSWLPANLGRDYYRKQAETHIASLAQKISNVQRQIEEQAGGLLDERDRLIQQRLWLQNELDNVGAG